MLQLPEKQKLRAILQQAQQERAAQRVALELALDENVRVARHSLVQAFHVNRVKLRKAVVQQKYNAGNLSAVWDEENAGNNSNAAVIAPPFTTTAAAPTTTTTVMTTIGGLGGATTAALTTPAAHTRRFNNKKRNLEIPTSAARRAKAGEITYSRNGSPIETTLAAAAAAAPNAHHNDDDIVMTVRKKKSNDDFEVVFNVRQLFGKNKGGAGCDSNDNVSPSGWDAATKQSALVQAQQLKAQLDAVMAQWGGTDGNSSNVESSE